MGFDQLNSDGDGNDAKTQADSKTDKAAGAAQDAYGKAKDTASDVADKATSAAEGIGAKLQDAARKVEGAERSEWRPHPAGRSSRPCVANHGTGHRPRIAAPTNLPSNFI